jgi:hypothetical protein
VGYVTQPADALYSQVKELDATCDSDPSLRFLFLQWEDARRRELTQQQLLALFEPETPNRPVEAAVRVSPASGPGEENPRAAL